MLRKRTVRVGVTGGIGSGKSYVCRLLEERGFPVFYTDLEAKREMVENAEIQRSLSVLLGTEAVSSDGVINKPALSLYISQGKEYADKVNGIVHPAVRKRMLDWLAGRKEEMSFVECALLYEAGFFRDMDYVLLVTAPLDVRISRVMERDGRSEEYVRRIADLQLSEEGKNKRADYVIVNDGIKDLNPQIDSFRRFVGR